jgi:hypothetical protein
MQAMGTEAPTIVVIPVHCAPKKAPCPKCGKWGCRKRTVTRRVRTVAYKAIAYLEITDGEYAARCECCTTFRNTPEGVTPMAHYDNKVRDLVRDRILHDALNVERATESLLLDLSLGFVSDVLRDHAAEPDLAAHRRTVLEHFSGTLCVDELHLGRFTLLLATDPLSDLPVAFALVAKFVVLSLNEVWSHWTPPEAKESERKTTVPSRKTQPEAGQTSRRVA